MSRSKYGAVRVTVDNITFDSKWESLRYTELKLLLKAGDIVDLELQPRFELTAVNLINGEVTPVGFYVADFRYRERVSRRVIVEDAKGVRTAVYRLKKRMVEAQHGIAIVEI